MKGQHAVRLLCKLLGLATSGYYRWRKGGSSQRQCEDAAITEQIVVAHEASRGTYGVPRILEDLRDAGTRVIFPHLGDRRFTSPVSAHRTARPPWP